MWGPRVPRDRPAPRFHLLGRTPFRPRAGAGEPSGSLQAPGVLSARRVRGGACQRSPAAAVEEAAENVSGRKPPCRSLRRRVGVLCPLSPAVPTHCPRRWAKYELEGPLNKQPGWMWRQGFIYRSIWPARRLSGLLSWNQVGRKTRPPQAANTHLLRKPLNVNSSSPTRAWSGRNRA